MGLGKKCRSLRNPVLRVVSTDIVGNFVGEVAYRAVPEVEAGDLFHAVQNPEGSLVGLHVQTRESITREILRSTCRFR